MLSERPVNRERVDALKAQMLNEQRIRVYKRNEPDDGHVFDSHGFLRSRPWTVGPTPEDARETCYETWEEAMHWATMPSKKRIEIIEIDALMEGGW